jgi:hypothetical protein
MKKQPRQRKKSFCADTDKPRITIKVYLDNSTVVTTIDKDGNIETLVEPP